ncbi:MAG: glycine zipper domain-containing protein [Verrucomicrobiota bacterium]|jgi:hypothetical protein|nr:glycine zipper domain-containing protein [Verrucomicrobiota bacterium]
MRNILLFTAFVLANQLQAQNLFNLPYRLGVPSLNAIDIPTPQQPQPQPSPQSRGIASPTAIVVGAAIGGLIGSNSQKTTEGAAIGGALGLLIGQMLERKALKKAERQVPPKGSNVRATAQIDPATGLPIDPNSLPSPTTDPATGLPIISSIPAPLSPATPRISPSKRVNKLFGR